MRRYAFLICLTFITSAYAQPIFTRAGGLAAPGAAPPWSVSASGSAAFSSVDADVSKATIAITGGTARSQAARASDELNMKDAGAVEDGKTDDTTALQKVFAIAQAKLNAGQPVGLWLPPGRAVISQTLTLTVPANGHLSIRGTPHASEIATTFSGTALQITAASGSGSIGTLISLSGIGAVKLAGAGAGGEAFEVLGGNPIPEVKIRNLRCDVPYGGSVAYGGTSTPWHSCVHLRNVVRSDIDGIISQNNGAHTGDPNQGIGLWLDATAGLYSIDNHVEHLQIVDGFAGVMATGHIEGLAIDQSTLLANAYNIYAPGRSYVNKDTTASQFSLWVSVAHSHMNSFLRGLYIVNGGSIKSDDNLYYNAGWSADGTPTNVINPPSTAWLPVDTSEKNPAATYGGYSFAEIDCVNCNDFTSTGDELFGNNAPLSDGLRLPLVKFDSTTDSAGSPAIAADDIHNFQGSAIAIDSGVTNGVVSGVRTNNVAACLSSGETSTISVGCARDGLIEGIGYQNGTAYLNGNLWAANGTLTIDTTGNASLKGALSAGGLISMNNIQTGKGSSFITTDANGNGAGYLTAGANGMLAAGTFTSGGTSGISADYLVANKNVTTGSYSVASLPTTCTPGVITYASDGRKSGEAAGAGSGVEVLCTPTAKGGTPVWAPLSVATSAVQN